MRWFKHLAMAHADPALSTLVEELGPGGYGIYWILLEYFACVMEKNCAQVPSMVHSDLHWAKLCYCSTRLFRKFVDRACALQLIECKTPAELKQYSSRTQAIRFEICIPKLLKYRDEYARKSGVTPDKLPARVDTDKEIKKESGNPTALLPLNTPPNLRKVAEQIHARHPAPKREMGVEHIAEKLSKILKKERVSNGQAEAFLELVNSRHAGFCASADWKGQYAWKLSNWLGPVKQGYRLDPAGAAPALAVEQSTQTFAEAFKDKPWMLEGADKIPFVRHQ